MKIGFDAKRAFINRTGLGNYSRTLIQSLVKQYPSNQYYLFSPKNGIDFTGAPPNVNIVSPAGFFHKKMNWYWRSFHLPVEQKRNGLEIFHGLSNELPFSQPPPKTKQVLTIHDLIFLKFPRFYPWVDRNIYKRKVEHSCRVADCIIAISEQTKSDLIEWLPFTEKKVKVIYQSCATDFSRDIPRIELERIKEKYNLPDTYILYVGSIAERKNLINLVKAFALLKNDFVKLIIVGEGKSYKAKLLTVISSLHLDNEVRILTNVSNEDLPKIYRQARLFVYPSLYEGFGIPIIEALYSKIPVVTTLDGCFHEAGGPHTVYADTGNINDLAEKLMEVLSNTVLRESMINEGVQYAQRFKPEVIAKNMMETYRTL